MGWREVCQKWTISIKAQDNQLKTTWRKSLKQLVEQVQTCKCANNKIVHLVVGLRNSLVWAIFRQQIASFKKP